MSTVNGNQLQWTDTKCSLCNVLADYRSKTPGLEFLCKHCRESADIIVGATLCAGPHGDSETAAERVQLLNAIGEVIETHYVCAECGWRWRESLGPEHEMLSQGISVQGEEVGKPFRLLRDDLRGAFWGEESEGVN